MAYRYIKAPAGYALERRGTHRDIFRLLFSSVLLTLGVTAFTSVLYPMIAYEINYAPYLNKSSVISPSSVGDITGDVIATSVRAAEEKNNEPTFAPEMVNTSLDYTNSNTWFGNAPQTPVDQTLIYYITIPKLGINRATVRNDHTDLKKSLIHYPGTALPGDLGNGVIFGHSVLPQFFNPKNYLTIFSTLHTLVPGDDIIIAEDNATYTYRVRQMYQVEPGDLTPLAQTYGGRYLTIITCTPPGTYLRRLIVRAELI